MLDKIIAVHFLPFIYVFWSPLKYYPIKEWKILPLWSQKRNRVVRITLITIIINGNKKNKHRVYLHNQSLRFPLLSLPWFRQINRQHCYFLARLSIYYYLFFFYVLPRVWSSWGNFLLQRRYALGYCWYRRLFNNSI